MNWLVAFLIGRDIAQNSDAAAEAISAEELTMVMAEAVPVAFGLLLGALVLIVALYTVKK